MRDGALARAGEAADGDQGRGVSVCLRFTHGLYLCGIAAESSTHLNARRLGAEVVRYFHSLNSEGKVRLRQGFKSSRDAFQIDRSIRAKYLGADSRGGGHV